jgi:hypothetical protein
LDELGMVIRANGRVRSPRWQIRIRNQAVGYGWREAGVDQLKKLSKNNAFHYVSPRSASFGVLINQAPPHEEAIRQAFADFVQSNELNRDIDGMDQTKL